VRMQGQMMKKNCNAAAAVSCKAFEHLHNMAVQLLTLPFVGLVLSSPKRRRCRRMCTGHERKQVIMAALMLY
jgi:hypothetical protein